MSSNKLQKFKNIFTANGSCGCDKSIDVRSPGPKSWTSDQNLPRPHDGEKSASDDDDDCASAEASPNFAAAPERSPAEDSPKLPKGVLARPSPKIFNSYAIVKDSVDPYGDFRRSMIQMIVEGEIHSRIELQQLLECFLLLNSPEYHDIILRAFEEILDGGDSPAAGDC